MSDKWVLGGDTFTKVCLIEKQKQMEKKGGISKTFKIKNLKWKDKTNWVRELESLMEKLIKKVKTMEGG